LNLGELGDMRLYQKVTADVTVADIRTLKDFVIREYACSRLLELGQEGLQILSIPDIGVAKKTSGNAFGGVVKKLANVPKQATVKVNLISTPPRRVDIIQHHSPQYKLSRLS
jgi:hypothetical protein